MKKKGIIFTISSAVIFGFAPLLTKRILESGVDVLSVLFYRNLMVLPLLFFMACKKSISFHIESYQFKQIILVGVFGTLLTGILLNISYLYIGVGTATTLHFLYPLFVALLARIMYHESLSKGKIVSLLLALLGIFCFVDIGGKTNLVGLIFASLSGLTYAFYMIQLEKKHLSKLHPFILSFYLSLVVCQVIIMMNVVNPFIVTKISLEIWFCLFMLASLCSILAISLLQLGTRYLGATTASLLCLFEPMSSIICGWLFLNESLSPLKIIGCAIILFAVIILVIDQNKKDQYHLQD